MVDDEYYLSRPSTDLSSREFRSEFFVDSVALSIANGLVLVFELDRIEYGMVLLVAGVVVAVGGLVASQVGSSSAEFLSAIMILFFFSELTYFVFFGMSFYLLGFSVQPRQIFFLPSIIFGLLVVLFSEDSEKEASQSPSRAVTRSLESVLAVLKGTVTNARSGLRSWMD